jgi:biotin carboxyl carrier protein
MNMRVKIGDQTFEVEIEDIQARPVIATIDGESFEVWPEEAQQVVAAPARPAPVAARPAAAPVAPAPRAAVPAPAGAGGKAITAPIPGKIIAVSVHPGDSVTVGQELLVLEAMKMKNAIRATRAGTIGTILVAVGDSVRHGQALVEFTD